MTTPTRSDMTFLASAASRGDLEAAERLLPLVYEELRRLATARLAKLPAGQTLQATALVHEAYVSLVGKGDPGWSGRGHFFGAAARAMRNILVDHARARHAQKRGGNGARQDLTEGLLSFQSSPDDVLMMDELVRRLEAEDRSLADILYMRVFAGMTNEEVSVATGVALRTIERQWRFGRAWLQRELQAAQPDAPTDRETPRS